MIYEIRVITNYDTREYHSFVIDAENIFIARKEGIIEAKSWGYKPDDVQEPIKLYA